MTETSPGLLVAETRHLVTVWNPAVAKDAMEAHLELLLELMVSQRKGRTEESDVFVWWGKIASRTRLKPLPHLNDILRLQQEQLDSEDGELPNEMHLYLTDYQSLYVGHVSEIVREIPREEDDPRHVPAFYREVGATCDCWFRLFDIRRIVHNDTVEVIHELRKLRNTRYSDRPVSMYGGMHELPLIVRRPDGIHWFGEDTRKLLTDGRYWAEVDSEYSGVREVMASLRDQVVGEETWSRLMPTARLFVACAEKLYREHQSDPAFDFSPVVIHLCKAYEAHLAMVLSGIPEPLRSDKAWLVNIDGRSRHLIKDGPFTATQLARALGELQDVVRRALGNGDWAAQGLPEALEELARVRNDGAHRERITHKQAKQMRAVHLGIGHRGHLWELARITSNRARGGW